MTTINSPKATDSLETWLSYLENAHTKPIDMGLERISSVANHLAIRKPAPYVITVAGTNGKGSTCKLLENALLLSGLRVGVYSSPHLIHYAERVRIQGEVLPDEAHIRAFDFIEKNRNASLTYFEFSTLSALYLFKQAQLDVVILEVGLGGRLDATNIVDTDFAVITSIDIDHVEFLGDNREVIGREKAGIFRKEIPVVIGEPDCPQSILEEIARLNCQATRRGRDWDYEISDETFLWKSATKEIQTKLPQIPTPNVGTGLAILTRLPFDITETILQKAVEETQMFGRFQRLQEKDWQNFTQIKPLAPVIIDVGHNPHAARYLAERLNQIKQPNQHIYAIFSALKDKDLDGIVAPLKEAISFWYCAGLHGWRGQSGKEVEQRLKHCLPNAKTTVFNDVASAAEYTFTQTTEKDLILVFGSFHTVADFWQWLNS